MIAHDGHTYGVRIYPEDGPGHTEIVKRRFGVLHAVTANTSHPTNGARGRRYRSVKPEAQDQAFTTLVLRAMAAPMDESLLFGDIPGTW